MTIIAQARLCPPWCWGENNERPKTNKQTDGPLLLSLLSFFPFCRLGFHRLLYILRTHAHRTPHTAHLTPLIIFTLLTAHCSHNARLFHCGCYNSKPQARVKPLITTHCPLLTAHTSLYASTFPATFTLGRACFEFISYHSQQYNKHTYSVHNYTTYQRKSATTILGNSKQASTTKWYHVF